MNVGTGQWWLAAHIAPSQPDVKLEVAIQRKLDALEVQQAREANVFVQRLASVASYALLVRLYHELEQVLERQVPAQRRANDLNRAARALGKASGGLADDLRRFACEDFGLGSEKYQELEQAIVEETGRAAFRLLVAVGQLDQGPFAVVAGAVTADDAAAAAWGAEAAGVRSLVEVVRLLRSGVVAAQRLMGRQLLIYRERIEEASLYLRRLAAEIPDGAATLVWSDTYDPERGERNLGQTTFDPLALDKALHLHRALRQARILLDATSSGERLDEASATAQTSGGHADRVQDVATPAVGVAADGQSSTVPGKADAPPGDREDQVIDLRALARFATAFIDELEMAWSAALDSVLLGEAQQEMDARYASLLRTIARRAGAADRALSAAGVDPGLPAYPLQPDELARLSFDPEPEQRWRQRQLAEIDALSLLLEALKGIREPSARLVYVDQQRVESWWEAGAFALIRDRAALLLRISEQVSSAEAELTGTSMTSAGPPAFVDRLRLAGSALGSGDIEAALMHTLLAVRLRAVLEHEFVPDDLLLRLAQDTRLAGDATVLRLLDQAATRLAANAELDLGVAMLLAPRALAVVRRLCLQTPQIILTALENRDDHDHAGS